MIPNPHTATRLLPALLLALAALSAPGSLLAEEEERSRVDHFIILLDRSGSMYLPIEQAAPKELSRWGWFTRLLIGSDSGPTGMARAKELLLALIEQTPELDYRATLLLYPDTLTVIDQPRFQREALASAIRALPEEGRIHGNRSPLGSALEGLERLLDSGRRQVVFLITDGGDDPELGPPALEVAARLYQGYPGTCIHTISVAASDDPISGATPGAPTEAIRPIPDAVAEVIPDTSPGEAVSEAISGPTPGTLSNLIPGATSAPLPEARSLLAEIAADGGCYHLDAARLLSQSGALNELAGSTLYALHTLPDSDADGVSDRRDRCPETAAALPVDSVGCPLDQDQDGVFDPLDRCAGTPQGARADEDGCWTLRGIGFAVGDAAIPPQAHKMLDEVAEVLRANPALRLEIEGHTDDRGPADFNFSLSAERAAAVQGYLIEQGIDSERLIARGYGPSKPVASNSNIAGRAKNRRVQLQPVSKSNP